MPIGALTGYIDVAQVVLYAFWIFFFGLVLYLHQEGKREGYPLVPDPQVPSDRYKTKMEGFPGVPSPKTFHLRDGTTRTVPNPDLDPDPSELKAVPAEPWPGAPLVPTGNPMLDGVGPSSYTLRPDEPEATMHGDPRFIPLRKAPDYSVASQDPDPRGMPVVGVDGEIGAEVVDIWIDLAELQIRYLEAKVKGSEEHVLLPITFARVNDYRRAVMVKSIKGSQFADVPKLKNPDQVTQLEEEKITAYYGGGYLYARANENQEEAQA